MIILPRVDTVGDYRIPNVIISKYTRVTDIKANLTDAEANLSDTEANLSDTKTYTYNRYCGKSTRFIQKVPGLGGYLKELTSFHSDISQAHFSSQF